MKISIELAPENGSTGEHMEMEGEAFFCAAYSQEPGGGVRAKILATGSTTAAGAALVLRNVAKGMMKELVHDRAGRALFFAALTEGLLEAEGDG